MLIIITDFCGVVCYFSVSAELRLWKFSATLLSAVTVNALTNLRILYQGTCQAIVWSIEK